MIHEPEPKLELGSEPGRKPAAELDHEPDLSVLLVTPAVTEPGPEGGTGAGAPPALWIPDEPVTLGTRTTGKLPVTFLNKVTIVFTSCSI